MSNRKFLTSIIASFFLTNNLFLSDFIKKEMNFDVFSAIQNRTIYAENNYPPNVEVITYRYKEKKFIQIEKELSLLKKQQTTVNGNENHSELGKILSALSGKLIYGKI